MDFLSLYSRFYLCIALLSVVLLTLVHAKCEEELNGAFLPDPRARNRFIYCWNGEEIPGQCDPGFEFDPFDRVCDYVGASSSDPCYNKQDDTFLPDPSSRFNFIFCSGGHSLVGTCERMMVFNPIEKVCEQDTIRTTQPPSRPTVTRNPCLNQVDGTFLHDPASRNAYFYCRGGVATNGNCPDGQLFFEDGGYCDVDSTKTTTRRPAPTTTRRTLPATASRTVPSRPVAGTTPRRPVATVSTRLPTLRPPVSRLPVTRPRT